jgi:hypothetical protein
MKNLGRVFKDPKTSGSHVLHWKKHPKNIPKTSSSGTLNSHPIQDHKNFIQNVQFRAHIDKVRVFKDPKLVHH